MILCGPFVESTALHSNRKWDIYSISRYYQRAIHLHCFPPYYRNTLSPVQQETKSAARTEIKTQGNLLRKKCSNNSDSNVGRDPRLNPLKLLVQLIIQLPPVQCSPLRAHILWRPSKWSASAESHNLAAGNLLVNLRIRHKLPMALLSDHCSRNEASCAHVRLPRQ